MNTTRWRIAEGHQGGSGATRDTTKLRAVYIQILRLAKLVSCLRAYFIDRDTESRDWERKRGQLKELAPSWLRTLPGEVWDHPVVSPSAAGGWGGSASGSVVCGGCWVHPCASFGF